MIKVLDIFIRKFKSEDAEHLRQIRNESNQFLITKDFISKEEQSKWLQSNDFNKNTFFSVEYQSDVIGFLNIKTKDTSGEVETGILFKKEYHNHHAPATAVIAMSYYLFTNTSINSLFSYVHKENKSAINMNFRLGFKHKNEFEKDFFEMNLHKSEFLTIYNQKFKKLKLIFAND